MQNLSTKQQVANRNPKMELTANKYRVTEHALKNSSLNSTEVCASPNKTLFSSLTFHSRREKQRDLYLSIASIPSFPFSSLPYFLVSFIPSLSSSSLLFGLTAFLLPSLCIFDFCFCCLFFSASFSFFYFISCFLFSPLPPSFFFISTFSFSSFFPFIIPHFLPLPTSPLSSFPHTTSSLSSSPTLPLPFPHPTPSYSSLPPLFPPTLPFPPYPLLLFPSPTLPLPSLPILPPP